MPPILQLRPANRQRVLYAQPAAARQRRQQSPGEALTRRMSAVMSRLMRPTRRGTRWPRSSRRRCKLSRYCVPGGHGHSLWGWIYRVVGHGRNGCA